MIKKEYIKPSVKAIAVQPAQIVCGSLDKNDEATAGEGGWGAPQSFDGKFEEEDE